MTGFEIVPLSNHDALAVLTLDESKPVTVQFAIPKNFLTSDLEIFHQLIQERFIGNTVLDIHYRLRTEIPQIVQRYFKTTDNVLDLFDYVFSQLFQELVFVEGKISSLTYADLQTYQFLDNPQHVALELRGGMPEDQMTQILVAESQEKALKNVTVISHKFLVPYRGMALMHVIGPVEMDYRRVISLVNVIGRVLVMKLTDYYRYLNKMCIRDRIVTKAKDLVAVGDEIAAELGIPIVNKRVSVTPISIIGAATNATDYVPFAKALDRAAKEVGVNFIGGFSALVQKGYQKGDEILINSIPRALAETDFVCSSVNIGSTKTGINMTAVRDMGRIIKEASQADPMGPGKLVVFANAVEDNPFMAGAFHGVGEADVVINVGVSGPGVVQRAIEKVPGASFDVLAETVKKTAFKITRVGQLVGQMASERLGVEFGIVDLSLAPTPAVGDSVARVLEAMGLEVVGTHGTTAALALLNDQVKKGGIMACNQVGGLSGAFIPVSEDEGMIAAVQSGHINLEKLEAMTAICSVGLDMIAIPADTPDTTIAAMIADEAAIGVINQKTTAVRIIPYGKEGDMLELGGLLGSAPVMKVNKASSADFIARGGQIPAPVHSFKN